MKLRHIEVFHALMNSRTMTEAAERLHVTQPAVSMVLKHAEQSIGMRLFNRSGGRLVPTPEAMSLIPNVDAIYERITELTSSAQRLRDAQAGVLSVVSTPTIANDLLPRAIAAYSQRRPQSRLIVRQINTTRVLREVATQRCEIGLASEPSVPISESLARQVIVRSKVHCVLGQDDPLAALDTISARDLRTARLISFGAGTPMGAVIARAFDAVDLPFAPTIEVSSSLAAIPMVAAGVGVALIESGRRLEAFRGIVTRPFTPTIESRILLLRHRENELSPSAAEFADVLRRTA